MRSRVRFFLRQCLRAVLLAWFRAFLRLRVRGAREVPPHGPCLIVSNHPSYLNPIVINALLARPVSFIAWEAIFRVPVLGRLARAFGAIPVSLEHGSVGSWREAAGVLARGGALGIFPEGHRTPRGVLIMDRWKTGAAHLAIRSAAPVVPVAIIGAERVWPVGQSLPRPGRVLVRFLPPITPPPAAPSRRRPGEGGRGSGQPEPPSPTEGRAKEEERAFADRVRRRIEAILARRRRALERIAARRGRGQPRLPRPAAA